MLYKKIPFLLVMTSTWEVKWCYLTCPPRSAILDFSSLFLKNSRNKLNLHKIKPGCLAHLQIHAFPLLRKELPHKSWFLVRPKWNLFGMHFWLKICLWFCPVAVFLYVTKGVLGIVRLVVSLFRRCITFCKECKLYSRWHWLRYRWSNQCRILTDRLGPDIFSTLRMKGTWFASCAGAFESSGVITCLECTSD